MRKQFYRYFTVALLAAAVTLTAASCHKKPRKEQEQKDKKEIVKEYIYAAMEYYYYWAEQIGRYSTNNKEIEDYFYSLLARQDRWSWMTDGDGFRSMETAVYTSYGFNFVQPIDYYDDYGVYVAYAESGSPAAEAGIERGYRLTAINGTPVETLIANNTFNTEVNKKSNKFTFVDRSGKSKEYNLTQKSFQSKSVLHSTIFTSADYQPLPQEKKVGYILYNSFTGSLSNEIISALTSMKNGGVTDLILDLRYNGGGDVSVLCNMANYLAPANADKKLFLTLKHNTQNREMDESFFIKREAQALDLTRLFVIIDRYTASASESLINCLKPYMQVHTIGGQTYGKPNGMYVITYPNDATISNVEYAFLPICFYCMNADDKADYDKGLIPENKRSDDVYHPFSPQEDLIGATLHYIVNGTYPALPTKTKSGTAVGTRAEFKQNRVIGAYKWLKK